MTTPSEPLGDAFQRAIEHWRRHRGDAGAASESDPQRAHLTVAISREVASGGKRIANELATKLGWPIYDRELVEKIAIDAGLNAKMVESVDERKSSFIVETLEAFSGASTMGGAGYAHRLANTLATLGAHGECVILGRGAANILPADTTVSIRLVAALSDRVAQYGERKQLDRQAAKSELQRLDKERDKFIRQYFHKDVADPHGYDLVVNTSRLSFEACVELCLNAVRQKESAL